MRKENPSTVLGCHLRHASHLIAPTHTAIQTPHVAAGYDAADRGMEPWERRRRFSGDDRALTRRRRRGWERDLTDGGRNRSRKGIGASAPSAGDRAARGDGATWPGPPGAPPLLSNFIEHPGSIPQAIEAAIHGDDEVVLVLHVVEAGRKQRHEQDRCQQHGGYACC
ncbi:hypothetical protein SEVIR_8G135950v4 [Setaria viridis]|uniref:Uncharacterized protein n=1 Tax=Setaria viridis TaxID=4556 RepID=A0A4U6TJN9_SETVI|nr:hypothetical protein SEVIR_8G135950v2 [Setaria viridis]